MKAPAVLLIPASPLKYESQPAGAVSMLPTAEAQPRDSTDTGINSIYSMYADVHSLHGGVRSSWVSRSSAEYHHHHYDRVRQSGDGVDAFSQPVTLNLHSSSAGYEPAAESNREPKENSPKVLTVPGDTTSNSPRVSLATTRAYSDLFEGGMNGAGDGSSSSNTTPAMAYSKDFMNTPHSHRQHSLTDLPPLPPSRQSSPSPPRKPSPASGHLAPQKPDDDKLSQASVAAPSSKVSLVPEDVDGFHVRNTYAQLEASGVKGDGYEEGIERTRARVGSSRRSQLQADAALGDGLDKKRDLDDKEIQALQSVDRYGFFSSASHDRLILLNSRPLLKKLSVLRVGPPTASPNAQVINTLPPVRVHPKEASRISKWNRMLIPQKYQEGGNVDEWRIRPSKESKFRERTYKGIPDRWRRAAWDSMMTTMAALNPSGYDRLAGVYHDALDKPSSYDVQIDLDVPRTIGGHIMFRTRYGAGQRSLFHVLHSFSIHCPSCGYVQGMGPIAATLLCYFEPERVYASLVILHDAYRLHSVFNPGFPGMLEAIYVQERITESTMPAVYAAFKTHMVPTTAYATKWYITLFANSVPFQTQLRLWDAFLLDGYDVFIAVAVAIVWVYKDNITSNSANFETVLSLLSSFFVPEDEDALMSWISNMLGDKKNRANIARWRRDWQALVAAGKEGTALL